MENQEENKSIAKKSVLTDEDKRELTMAVKQTATGIMNPVEYEQTRIIARDLIKSNALPKDINNVEQVMIMISAGREMGMTPFEAIHDLYFVGGKLNLQGKATPSAIRRAGWRIEKYDEDETKCTATIRNPKTGETITDTFTFEDAELSGFTKDGKGYLKFGWRRGANRKRKLRYGVLSQIIHTYIPEVLSSVVGIGDYSEDYEQAAKDIPERDETEARAKKLAKLDALAEAGEAEVVNANN